ncbi:MAG TPA: hypothetical protein VKA84_07355, partial [Gemmatimonadaceae bacterium]|nr:hypothetical protein [Gemmatimonadaceae bacterium]
GGGRQQGEGEQWDAPHGRLRGDRGGGGMDMIRRGAASVKPRVVGHIEGGGNGNGNSDGNNFDRMNRMNTG